MSILNDVQNDLAAASRAGSTNASGNAKPQRESSKIWLNVGLVLEGAGEDGTDLFVSLPVGIPVDDIKPQQIRGNNEAWIQLAQTKNYLLEAIQKAAAKLEAGQRHVLDGMSVEIYRKAEPDQAGTTAENPLMAALQAKLTGGKVG